MKYYMDIREQYHLQLLWVTNTLPKSLSLDNRDKYLIYNYPSTNLTAMWQCESLKEFHTLSRILIIHRFEQHLCELILSQTTTLGVRVLPITARHEARRERRTVDTPFGPITVKLKFLGNDLAGASPEYDDCLVAAKTANVPVKQVHDAAITAAQEAGKRLATGD